MRIALWMASPPTCSVRTPRESLTAMGELFFLAEERGNGRGSEEGKESGGEDRRIVAAQRVEGRTGEPRPDQRADAGAGVEAADDAGDVARAIEVHDDGRQQRHVGAVAGAEDDGEDGEQPPRARRPPDEQ